MEGFYSGKYDVIVLGAGQAGCEAALACARMGFETLCLTINLDSVAYMACNPAIGGTSKGHLVRELDAMGGEMGLAADDCMIQMRMLNTAKGPAVHSLRAQMDKRRYHERMKSALENQERLTLKQDECSSILTKGNRVTGVTGASGAVYDCRAVIVATGVYLKSRILIGDYITESGPAGLFGANALSKSLTELGFQLRRFKTGTPARIHRRSIDFSKMEPQYGDEPIVPFSFLTKSITREQHPCYLTYTNPRTHEIIMENLHRSPMYKGVIKGTGARYCPSIEDKVVRFADKERHQIFIEPEGLTSCEMYVQGMSTSMPADVQVKMLRTLSGLENCEVMRPGYAIEYDCIDPTALTLNLGSREISGLYFAGQINGTSGYEEAAAQGLYAGINCALWLKGEPPLTLTRSDAYIGVLCDDLATKGVDEPYRMMTSRAEYRLLLRQDNADLRLTELALRTGLISKERYERMCRRQDDLKDVRKALESAVQPDKALQALLIQKGLPEVKSAVKLFDLLKRPQLAYTDLLQLDVSLPLPGDGVIEQIEIQARYDGYIQKQKEQAERFRGMEQTELPEDIDYTAIPALRTEARQKLSAKRPSNLGQASRIPGVSPADIAVLLIKLRQLKQGKP